LKWLRAVVINVEYYEKSKKYSEVDASEIIKKVLLLIKVRF
jgi:hypothetical protein